MVVLAAPLLEVLGQVFIGVAPGVCAHDPDLLAPQLLPQCLKSDYFVDHPGHAGPAAGVGAVDQVGPVSGGTPMGGDGFPERVVRQVGGLGIPPDQRQGIDHRAVGGVTAAELQNLQQRDQTAPVVPGV